MNQLSTLNSSPAGQHSQSLQTSESSRTLGEIQAMLTVAAARPRNEIASITKITNACQRQRLAENAEYAYSKGGTKVSGATIRLLEVIGQNWGNMTWGFRELSQVKGKESTVQAFAWDLENNVKVTRDFVVSHQMSAYGKTKTLTDEREIYEFVANKAQRRVRTCLENCIPKDIIEDALDCCKKTLIAEVDITPESVAKMVAAFAEKFQVTKEQIEARIQRKLEAIEPAQFLALRRIFASILDGMSTPEEWFKDVEAKKVGQARRSDLNESKKPKGNKKKPTEKPQPEFDIAAVEDDAIKSIMAETEIDKIDLHAGNAEKELDDAGVPKEISNDILIRINQAGAARFAELTKE